MREEEHVTELYCGNQLEKYGPLPKVELPGDDETILRFVGNLLPHIKDKALYRRDNVVVIPYVARARLEFMKATTFRTWIERYVVCFRVKHDQDEPFEVVRTITREIADAVIDCADFWPHLREIYAVNPVPLPCIPKPDEPLKYMRAGYDEATQMLTFEP